MLSSLSRLLPVLLIAAVLMGNGLFAATNVLPHLTQNQQLTTEVEAQRTALENRDAATSEDELLVLNRQLEVTQNAIDDSAATFLNENQVDELVERLYIVAEEVGVVITSLRTQGVEEDENPVYEVQQMQLQVEGDVPQLMNFVISFREAAQPVVQLDNLAINASGNRSVLTADLRLHLSPRATGDVLVNLIEPLPLITVVEAEPTRTEAPASAEGEEQVVLPPDEAVNTSTLTGTEADCASAPPTLFAIGDRAVVDFNGESALNVLTAPRSDGTEADIIVQAYDNHTLTILDGPVCGQWEARQLYYWYVEYAGVRGWVGEAVVDNRWLCTEDEPECAP